MNIYHIAWILVIIIGVIIKDNFKNKSVIYNIGFVIGAVSTAFLLLAKQM